MAIPKLGKRSQLGLQDPMLAAMLAEGLKPTIDSYLAENYPDRDVEDLKNDPEVMSMIPPQLTQEDQET